MKQYTILVFAAFAILLSWAFMFKYLVPVLKQKGFKISPREARLLIILLFIISLALLYTFIKTSGTFIWK